MKLNYISKAALENLKVGFDDYRNELLSPDRSWINGFLQEEKGILETNIEIDDIELVCEGEFDVTDLQNTIELYDKMKDIPLSMAADERLWAWLALIKCWDYTYYRRKADWSSPKKADSKQKDNKAFNSFFFLYSESRSQVVNSMSRLWWAGYYTYDDTRSDPYELTKFFLKKAYPSNVMLLQSSKITANKEIRLGIIEGLKKWSEDTGKDFDRKHFVGVTKYLNLMGGVSILDFYTRDDIRNLTHEYLMENFA